MNLLTKFHRWRYSKTQFWLPYEIQIHDLLLKDARITELHKALQAQTGSLYEAVRSWDVAAMNGRYAYQTSTFYDVSSQFKLCSIHAANAMGTVHFGGGMLSEIRLRPNELVQNPGSFRLQEASLSDVSIPRSVPTRPASGWVAKLEEKGILVRQGQPNGTTLPIEDCPAHQQYAELFNQCESAQLLVGSEQFHFHSPPLETVHDQNGAWAPILDLRELGGLAIRRAEDGFFEVIYLNGGQIEWTEPDLASALEWVHSRFEP